mgnify:CR=1 FL=1
MNEIDNYYQLFYWDTPTERLSKENPSSGANVLQSFSSLLDACLPL